MPLCNKIQENTDITGATGIIINITSGPDFTLSDLEKILNIAQSNADENVNIIYGQRVDETMKEKVSITLIATGFPPNQKGSGIHYPKPKVDNPNVVPIKEWDKMQKTPVRAESNAEWGNVEQPAYFRLRGRVPGIRTEE